jgi:acyl-CoA hydrolase
MFPSDTLTIMNEMVLPNDTNPLHNLRGGRLLHWMDICGAMSAQKLARAVCVTAAVDNVAFNAPIRLGDVVSIQSKVVRSFNSSMEVYVEVFCEDLKQGTRLRSNEAFYTFVVLPREGERKPPALAEISPVTDEEKLLFDRSLVRKQYKLLSAGKITLEEAPQLREQFETWMAEAQPTSGR